MISVHSIAWWPTVAVVTAATVTDLRTRRIPNWLSLPFMAAGIAVSCWCHGAQGLQQSLEGLGLGAAVFGFLFMLGGMGMGDVKLLAGIGAWIGPGQLVLALVLTAFAGGVMALGWAIYGGFAGELLRNSGELVVSKAKRRELVLANPRARKMPYAPAIAIGALLSFFGNIG